MTLEMQDQLKGRGIRTFVDDLLCHSSTCADSAEHLQFAERLFIRLDMYRFRLN